MTKKIVAIGGGENGRYLGNGKYREYETEPMDKEIIRLTGKENPNYLFMVHAQPFNNTIEEGYFETMKKIYGDMFGCNCRYLKSTELDDMEVVKEKIAQDLIKYYLMHILMVKYYVEYLLEQCAGLILVIQTR